MGCRVADITRNPKLMKRMFSDIEMAQKLLELTGTDKFEGKKICCRQTDEKYSTLGHLSNSYLTGGR